MCAIFGIAAGPAIAKGSAALIGKFGFWRNSTNKVSYVPLNAVNYTQGTINTVLSDGTPLPVALQSMKVNGWDLSKGMPDMVIRPSGGYMTIDNRRIVIADLAGLDTVPAKVHQYTELLPKQFVKSERYQFFKAPADYTDLVTGRSIMKNELPKTWGEAASIRSMQQQVRPDVTNFHMHGRSEMPSFYGPGKKDFQDYINKLIEKAVYNGPK